MPPTLKRSALYFIWQNPWMVAGRATFIHHMMEAAGFSNAASTLDDSRYPVLTKDEILALRPEVILLSSEPFPFRSSHASTMALQMSPSEVLLVDGEMFSWYGSRMGLAGSYFASLKKDKK
jgi:ABC-type hemin transport system substrate-binding protein